MATIIGNQSITIGSETLAMSKSWVAKYHNELKKGNTTIKKATSATNGEAILRVSHQVTKGVEGHVISLEIEGTRGSTTPTRKLVKAQTVLTCESHDVEEKQLLQDVVVGLCTWLPTVIGDIMDEKVD